MRALKSATRNSLLLFAACLAFHLLGTWSLPLIDRDEPRFAEASREMMQRGDYVVPFFNNAYRFDKPPLTYWCQVASYRVFGDNDFAARFPSAIAAALIAVLLLNWATRIGNDSVGWSAALIFTLCLQTFVHAKAAVADMWLALFVTAAHFAGYQLLTGERRRFAWWGFYISLALAFLAKGPIGWTPLLAAAVFLIATKQATRMTPAALLRCAAGILLMLAIVCAWGIPALIRTHGDFYRIGIGHHVIERSVATMEGHGASSPLAYVALLPFYFVTVFASFFPWSVKLPWLMRRLWRERDLLDVYLISGTLIIFIVFSLVRTKLPHYTLPAFPVLALLLARHLPSRAFVRRTAIISAVAFALTALVLPPLVAKQFAAFALYRTASNQLTPDMQLATVEFDEPSIVWYFRNRLTTFVQPIRGRDAASFLLQPGPRAVIIPTTTAKQRLTSLPLPMQQFDTHGFNIPKGKRVDISLFIKRE